VDTESWFITGVSSARCGRSKVTPWLCGTDELLPGASAGGVELGDFGTPAIGLKVGELACVGGSEWKTVGAVPVSIDLALVQLLLLRRSGLLSLLGWEFMALGKNTSEDVRYSGEAFG
jgi:hypothetical protein